MRNTKILIQNFHRSLPQPITIYLLDYIL